MMLPALSSKWWRHCSNSTFVINCKKDMYHHFCHSLLFAGIHSSRYVTFSLFSTMQYTIIHVWLKGYRVIYYFWKSRLTFGQKNIQSSLESTMQMSISWYQWWLTFIHYFFDYFFKSLLLQYNRHVGCPSITVLSLAGPKSRLGAGSWMNLANWVNCARLKDRHPTIHSLKGPRGQWEKVNTNNEYFWFLYFFYWLLH